MKYQRIILSTLALATSFTMSACASKAPEGDISATANPQDEIARLESDLKNAQQEDVDVLAFKKYDKSVKHLEEAKSDLASRQSQDEIINDLRFGRQALDAAKGTASYRKTKAPALFEARQAAIKAGAATKPELRSDWTKVDQQVIDNAEDLSKLNSATLVGIQNSYAELERKTVVLTQLGGAKVIIDAAKKDDADKAAPKTFKTAQLEYAQAESTISRNVRNESRFAGAVLTANASARMLGDVMTTIKTSSAKNLPEATAVKLVMQDRKIRGLTTDLSLQKSETDLAETDARQKEIELSNNASTYQNQLSEKDGELRRARETIGVQAALDKARKEFSPSEAEAYQQGNNLVIRLKSVKFASGRSELPQNSLSILAKVSDVAKELGAAKIRVEGHTDSVGGPTSNQTLSEKRANAVATYFKTSGVEGADVTAEGFGLSKPLASNKSAAGRAENRRVDVVITPEASVTE